MKRKIFTLMFCALFGATLVNAQDRPTGVFTKVDAATVVDGAGDEAFWADAPKYNIDKDFQTEVATLGESGETYFQTVWNADGISVLVTVNDEQWRPGYETGVADWQSDKIEVYFDVNTELLDGKGGGAGKATGHYQFAPTPIEAAIDGTATTDANGWTWAYLVDGDAAYVFELFVPMDYLTDNSGAVVLPTTTVGFDVTAIDNDGEELVRRRAVWANVGLVNESYNNMDDCGWMTFEGAGELVSATSITISSASDKIEVDNGTLQMVATVKPDNATVTTAAWTVENVTGKATINGDGILTAVLNGTVIVTGTTKDGTALSDSKEITIINQAVTISDINVIKNGNFDQGDNGKAEWVNNDNSEVIDGWLVTTLTPMTNRWDNSINQRIVIKDAETKYLVKFKAYADVEMVTPLIEEDANNGWNKDIESSSPWWVTSDSWQIPTTTEEAWYELDMKHPKWLENSSYAFNWQLGALEGTFYLDSVSVVAEDEMALLTPAATSIELKTVEMTTSITTAGGTLQVTTTVAMDAYPVYSIVKGTGDATITAKGLVTAVANGTVTVVGKDPVDPTVMDELEITISGQPIGVNEDLANQFSIYPNPVNNELNVELTSTDAKIVIYNSLGSKIYEETANNLLTRIDVSSFARGVYFVQVNNSAAQKFVK